MCAQARCAASLAAITWAIVAFGNSPNLAHSAPSGPVEPAGRILSINVSKRVSPAFGGESYGSAGTYELIEARVDALLNPDAAENAMIAGLKNAPRNAAGMVEYSFDMALLKPVDIAKSNGKLVYQVVNRGHGAIDLDGNSDAGTAFYMRQGYVFINAGWQGELRSNGRNLVAYLPIATESGDPIVQLIRQEVNPAAQALMNGRTVADGSTELIYPAAIADSKAAQLYVRQLEGDRWRRLPSTHLEFIDRAHVRLAPASGYDEGAIYDIVYRATEPVISGIGLALVRDLISFLRFDGRDGSGGANPLLCGDGVLPIRAAYAIGYSQSGRYLRFFLWQGFNQDSQGRRVFDGVMPVIAGARKGDFNRLFAQPGTSSTQHEWRRAPDNNFPFAYATLEDPVSSRVDGILARCAKSGTCPKVMHLDSGNEMASAFSWMLTTDAKGAAVEQPANVRLYYAAGLQHGPGDRMPGCRAEPVPYSWMPFQRALFVAMDQWVSEDLEPPATRYPNRANGSLVSLDAARKQWPKIPGHPFSAVRNVPGYWDYSLPLAGLIASYPVFTPRLNQDGNEMDGIVHPQIAVPLGTISGHSLRATGNAEGDQCLLQGEFLPFALDRAQRQAKRDPRLSIEQRYPGGNAEYRVKVSAAVHALVAERLLLPEDAAELSAASLPRRQ